MDNNNFNFMELQKLKAKQVAVKQSVLQKYIEIRHIYLLF